MKGSQIIVFGIDLSGPANSKGTAMACFVGNSKALRCMGTSLDLDDLALYRRVVASAGKDKIVVGLDAPLSYNPSGGDRPVDKALRRLLVAAGLHPGVVMAPTAPRMGYLTLRGVCVARLLESIRPSPPAIVEVHPAGAMVLGGARPQDVGALKTNSSARRRLLRWLAAQGLQGIRVAGPPTDHIVAAAACALGAWKWTTNRSALRQRSAPPFHPYDFAC